MPADRRPGTLWDPLPVTLPTYVTKPAATRRTVRTIDLGEPGAWTSGHTDETSARWPARPTPPPRPPAKPPPRNAARLAPDARWLVAFPVAGEPADVEESVPVMSLPVVPVATP